MQTVAEVLAQTLSDAGVETVFGLPGGENVQVLDAIRRAGIRFVLVHNESSAVFMADATARLTGTPGVCLTTLGPGATNAVAGVAHAYLDRAPVLLITAQIPDHLRPCHTHQFVDLHALFAPITKRSVKLEPAGARETVRAALELTTRGRPGPVHLQVSNADAGQPAPAGAATLTPGRPLDGSARAEDIAAARDLLAQSSQPAIVVGLGLEPERPYQALRELAEAANAPVITTPKAKGSLPDDHPLSAGTVGLGRTDPVYAILDEADCIVAVGFDVVELVKPWEQTVPLIWIAPWANEDPILPTDVELVGPMAPVLRQLAEAEFRPSPEWGAARVATLRQALAKESLPSPAPGRMLPQSVLRALRASLPREAILATDVGSHKILAALTWPTYTPNSYLVTNGLSSMSFGLPAAVAASLALPQRPVVCLTGDGGLAMVLGELGLLARLGVTVIVVVLNDGALDLIRSQQVRAGKPVYGTEFVNPDFVSIAAAYGIDTYRVRSEEVCAEAVTSAIAAGRPTVIEAMIDPISYPTTPSLRRGSGQAVG